MYTQTVRPAPELKEDRKPKAGGEPAPDMLVQYPKSASMAVTLPVPGLWAEIGAAAMTRRSIARASARADHLSDATTEAAASSGLALSWLLVVTGVLLVAALWSAILF